MPKGIRKNKFVQLNGIQYVDIHGLMEFLKPHVQYSLIYIRRLAEGGKIPATRIRYRWFFNPQAVLDTLLKPDDRQINVDNYI